MSSKEWMEGIARFPPSFFFCTAEERGIAMSVKEAYWAAIAEINAKN